MEKPKPVMTRGARMLRDWRLASGLTALQLATQIGIDPSTYCSYERGRQEPRIARLKRIQEVTGVPIEAWADVEEDAASPDGPAAA